MINAVGLSSVISLHLELPFFIETFSQLYEIRDLSTIFFSSMKNVISSQSMNDLIVIY